jgi:uncharacterized BrkB/YihY/UPF0761 family membrane protein
VLLVRLQLPMQAAVQALAAAAAAAAASLGFWTLPQQALQHCHCFSPCRLLLQPPLLLLLLLAGLVVVVVVGVLSVCMTCASLPLLHGGWCCCIRSLRKSAAGEQ